MDIEYYDIPRATDIALEGTLVGMEFFPTDNPMAVIYKSVDGNGKLITEKCELDKSPGFDPKVGLSIGEQIIAPQDVAWARNHQPQLLGQYAMYALGLPSNVLPQGFNDYAAVNSRNLKSFEVNLDLPGTTVVESVGIRKEEGSNQFFITASSQHGKDLIYKDQPLRGFSLSTLDAQDSAAQIILKRTDKDPIVIPLSNLKQFKAGIEKGMFNDQLNDLGFTKDDKEQYMINTMDQYMRDRMLDGNRQSFDEYVKERNPSYKPQELGAQAKRLVPSNDIAEARLGELSPQFPQAAQKSSMIQTVI